MSSSSTQLQAVHLIEKDTNNEVLWAWSFPGVDGAMRNLLMKKCNLDKQAEEDSSELLPFMFGHFLHVWYYFMNFKVDEGNPKFPKVTDFSVVILSKDFNPEKYRHMASIFGSTYLSQGTLVSILTHYLSVYTREEISSPPSNCDSFTVKNYSIKKAYVACCFKDVVSQFGIESILIYTALLLKRRVAVYAASLQNLLNVTRALPLFVVHRMNWDILYPHMDLEEEELQTLSSNATYIAGFTDSAIEGRTELYDLFVNVSTGSISIAPHAKDMFNMTKLHKDIAMHLQECVDDQDFTDQATVKELSIKTKELISNTKSLAPPGEKLTLEVLRARKMTPAQETFLYTLAAMEGFAQL